MRKTDEQRLPTPSAFLEIREATQHGERTALAGNGLRDPRSPYSSTYDPRGCKQVALRLQASVSFSVKWPFFLIFHEELL